jgi:hypothetical protein
MIYSHEEESLFLGLGARTTWRKPYENYPFNNTRSRKNKIIFALNYLKKQFGRRYQRNLNLNVRNILTKYNTPRKRELFRRYNFSPG